MKTRSIECFHEVEIIPISKVNRYDKELNLIYLGKQL